MSGNIIRALDIAAAVFAGVVLLAIAAMAFQPMKRPPMSADLLWFPFKLDDKHGKTMVAEETDEPCAKFVARMTLEASRWIDESPSAAAVFLYAAARRLHREAIEREGIPNILPPPPPRRGKRKK